jgi:hypothetical protein
MRSSFIQKIKLTWRSAESGAVRGTPRKGRLSNRYCNLVGFHNTLMLPSRLGIWRGNIEELLRWDCEKLSTITRRGNEDEKVWC